MWFVELDCQEFEHEFSKMWLGIKKDSFDEFFNHVLRARLILMNNLEEPYIKYASDAPHYKGRIKFYKNTISVLSNVYDLEFRNHKAAVLGFVEASQDLFKFVNTPIKDLDQFCKIMDQITLYKRFARSISSKINPEEHMMESEMIRACTRGIPFGKVIDKTFEYSGVDPNNWVWPEDL